MLKASERCYCRGDGGWYLGAVTERAQGLEQEGHARWEEGDFVPWHGKP